MEFFDTLLFRVMIFLIVGSPLVGYIIRLLLAKKIAIKQKKQYVSFFGGYLQLVLWEANEGVVFLKDKRLWKFYPKPDDSLSDQGDHRWISPLRGEELRAHFPMRVKTLKWVISDITTKEEIDIIINVVIFWQVNEVDKFVFNIGNEIRLDDSSYITSLTTSAEEKIKDLTQSILGTRVSKMSLAFLKSTNITKYLTGVDSLSEGDNSIGKDDLANIIKEDINKETLDDGIIIRQLKIERITLPEHIKEKLISIQIKTLEPIEAELDAKKLSIKSKSDYESNKSIGQADLDAYIASLGPEIGSKLLMLKESRGLRFETKEEINQLLKSISINIDTKKLDSNEKNP